MTEFLINKFVKSKDNKNNQVREKAGTLSSIVGICCNIALFIAKYFLGTLANSIAIISDGFNNLSDCLSCVITFFAYKLSNKPADKDHPFGHGRIEYFSSLIIAVLILFVGFEFAKTSIEKIFHPETTIFTIMTAICLVISILVKLWMSLFNKKMGNIYNSPTMLATSSDSFSDSIITIVTLVSLIIGQFTTLPIDGIVGTLVSLLILKSGYEIIKDTVDTLLGKPAEKEILDDINSIVFSHPDILGVHDVIVHNYGPGKIMATLHAEVDSNQNILEAHEMIDDIEKDLYDELKIMATIHMDPIEINNKDLNMYKEVIAKILNEIDPTITYHDFRMVPGQNHTNLIFDIVVDHKYIQNTEELKKQIDIKLHLLYPHVYTVITFDTQF